MGMMGLDPEQFYRMTPWEFKQKRDGWMSLFEVERKQTAHWVATIMNVIGVEEPVTADDLLGKKQESESQTIERLKQRALKRRMERARAREKESTA